MREQYFVIAHEYAHWIKFTTIGRKIKEFYERGLDCYLDMIRDRKVAESLYVSATEKHMQSSVVPSSIEEVKERIIMTTFPICTLSRLLVLPMSLLMGSIREANATIKGNDIEAKLNIIEEKHEVLYHVAILRIIDDDLVEYLLNNQVTKE